MIDHVRILKNYVQELHVDTDIGTKSLWLKCWQARLLPGQKLRFLQSNFTVRGYIPVNVIPVTEKRVLPIIKVDIVGLTSESGGIALEDKQGKFVWDYAAPRV